MRVFPPFPSLLTIWGLHILLFNGYCALSLQQGGRSMNLTLQLVLKFKLYATSTPLLLYTIMELHSAKKFYYDV